ncbi:MAG: hypothetical protein EOO73_22960 [Myxococcales bacterium]|nr:MAG: hypothetical protein EOO73_22960 [Myxococcales bacterium]
MHRFALALLLVACGGGPKPADNPPGGTAGSGAGGGAGTSATEDPEPALGEQELAMLRSLSPSSLPAPPEDATNKYAEDDAAARFGQALFFDPRFSGQLLDGDNDASEHALGMKGDVGKVACAGCHVPEDGFSDTRTLHRQVSLGAGWGLRRAPSLLDSAQSRLLMWDGRRDSYFAQAFGVLENEVEMNSSRLFAAHQVFTNHRQEYEAIFGPLPPLDDATRFPQLSALQTGCRSLDRNNKCVGVRRGAPGDGAEFDALPPADQDAITRVFVNVGKALGAYERRLTCGAAPFDAWMQGNEEALSRAAKRGAGLFVGRAGCVKCHSGPYFSDEKFHNVGLQPALVAVVFIDANDQGASAGLTQLLEDPLNSHGGFSDGMDDRLARQPEEMPLGAFRTPRLRCVSSRPSFMHTAQLRSLQEVTAFFNRGGDKFGFLGASELQPLGLSEREQADLVAFLESLSGRGPDVALLAPP